VVAQRIYPFRPEWLVEEGPNGKDVTSVEDFRWWLPNVGTDFRHSERPDNEGDIFLYAWKQHQGAWAIVGEARVRRIEVDPDESLRFRIQTESAPEVYRNWVPWTRIFPGDRSVSLNQAEYEAIRRKVRGKL
jgi:hypothetical protein